MLVIAIQRHDSYNCYKLLFVLISSM